MWQALQRLPLCDFPKSTFLHKAQGVQGDMGLGMAALLSRATLQTWLLLCGVGSLIWVVLVPHNFNKNTRPAVHTLSGFPGLTGSQTNSLHDPRLPAQRLPEVRQKGRTRWQEHLCGVHSQIPHRHSITAAHACLGVWE